MSRSDYCDEWGEGNTWAMIRWRGAVKSALNSRRGQAFLRAMVEALDALPEPKLIADKLESEGSFCAIGAVGRSRGVDMTKLDPHDAEGVAAAFDIAPALVREIVHTNDEDSEYETPEGRFERMRWWVMKQLIEPAGKE